MTRRYADKSRIRALMAEHGWTYTQAREHLQKDQVQADPVGAGLGLLYVDQGGCDECGAEEGYACTCGQDRYRACEECGADFGYQCNCPDPGDDQPDEPDYDWRDFQDDGDDPEPPDDYYDDAPVAVYSEAAPW
ncbi:MAG: hypothetical protein AUG49_25245 [Catenulispora sp. 13_1_20CM_3_70_7]|nr:MAG: hypothetical protein AUG49_25245 [Catenulispora sp. 13_1_20CM_3_70_7]